MRTTVIIALAVVILCGCSSFSDTINVYVGDNNSLFSLSGVRSGAGPIPESVPAAAEEKLSLEGKRRGFRCEFETRGEKPSIFSTKTVMSGHFECVRTDGAVQ